jgi:hypothetical protein
VVNGDGEKAGWSHLRDPHEQAQGEAAPKAQVEQAEAHHSQQSHQLGVNRKDQKHRTNPLPSHGVQGDETTTTTTTTNTTTITTTGSMI